VGPGVTHRCSLASSRFGDVSDRRKGDTPHLQLLARATIPRMKKLAPKTAMYVRYCVEELETAANPIHFRCFLSSYIWLIHCR
jgi:hypothetical protein